MLWHVNISLFIDFSINIESVPISVDNTEDESELKISEVENTHPPSKPAAATSSSSKSTPRNSSTSAVSTSSASDTSFNLSPKIPNMKESTQKGVKRMSYDYEYSIYVHKNTELLSYGSNPQYSCNYEPTFDYYNTKVSIDRDIYAII